MHIPSFRFVYVVPISIFLAVTIVAWWRNPLPLVDLTVTVGFGLCTLVNLVLLMEKAERKQILLRWKQPELYKATKSFIRSVEKLDTKKERFFYKKGTHEAIYYRRSRKHHSYVIVISTIIDEDRWRTSKDLIEERAFFVHGGYPPVYKYYSLREDGTDQRLSKKEAKRVRQQYWSLPENLKIADTEEIQSILPYFDMLQTDEYEERT